MSSTNQPKQKKSAFKIWYNSQAGQRAVSMTYSLGAAIVIIGALFKLEHWPGASIILTLGMCTEAFLFTIGVFEKPHPNYSWHKVFPILLASEETESKGIDVSQGGVLGGAMAAISGNGSGVTSLLKQSDSEKLEASIKALSETAGNLTNITKAAAATDTYAQKIDEAAKAAAAFADRQHSLQTASAALTDAYQSISQNVKGMNDGSKQYAAQSDALNKNLSAINTVYEMQLKNAQAQAEAFKAQAQQVAAVTDSMSKLQDLVSGTAHDFTNYKQATEQLVKQVSDLNSVYGNMLSAMHQ